MTVRQSSADDELDDLAPVLEYIGRDKRLATRAKLANNPDTRDFLELGLDLMREDLLEHTGPNLDFANTPRLFESVSRDRIIQRAEEQDAGADTPKMLTVAKFRNRWERKEFFTEDLISYLFRPYPQHRHIDEMESAIKDLLPEVNFGKLVRAIAEKEIVAAVADPHRALRTIVQIALPRHPRVHDYFRTKCELVLSRYAPIYERVATAYGVALRQPQLQWLDVALLLNTVLEGALPWARIVGKAPPLSNGDSVVAGAVIAMMPSLLEDASGWETRMARD